MASEQENAQQQKQGFSYADLASVMSSYISQIMPGISPVARAMGGNPMALQQSAQAVSARSGFTVQDYVSAPSYHGGGFRTSALGGGEVAPVIGAAVGESVKKRMFTDKGVNYEFSRGFSADDLGMAQQWMGQHGAFKNDVMGSITNSKAGAQFSLDRSAVESVTDKIGSMAKTLDVASELFKTKDVSELLRALKSLGMTPNMEMGPENLHMMIRDIQQKSKHYGMSIESVVQGSQAFQNIGFQGPAATEMALHAGRIGASLSGIGNGFSPEQMAAGAREVTMNATESDAGKLYGYMLSLQQSGALADNGAASQAMAVFQKTNNLSDLHEAVNQASQDLNMPVYALAQQSSVASWNLDPTRAKEFSSQMLNMAAAERQNMARTALVGQGFGEGEAADITAAMQKPDFKSIMLAKYGSPEQSQKYRQIMGTVSNFVDQQISNSMSPQATAAIKSMSGEETLRQEQVDMTTRTDALIEAEKGFDVGKLTPLEKTIIGTMNGEQKMAEPAGGETRAEPTRLKISGTVAMTENGRMNNTVLDFSGASIFVAQGLSA